MCRAVFAEVIRTLVGRFALQWLHTGRSPDLESVLGWRNKLDLRFCDYVEKQLKLFLTVFFSFFSLVKSSLLLPSL